MPIKKEVFYSLGSVPVTLEFDEAHGHVAQIDMRGSFGELSNLHEYVMVPAVAKDKDGKLIVVGYSFVHHTHVMPQEVFKDSMRELKKSKGYWISPSDGDLK